MKRMQTFAGISIDFILFVKMRVEMTCWISVTVHPLLFALYGSFGVSFVALCAVFSLVQMMSFRTFIK